MSKMYSSKQVSDIIQKRVKKMNDKMDEIKKENEYLREMIVDALKKQYAERASNGNGTDFKGNDERRRAKSRGQGQGGRKATRADGADGAIRREERGRGFFRRRARN